MKKEFVVQLPFLSGHCSSFTAYTTLKSMPPHIDLPLPLIPLFSNGVSSEAEFASGSIISADCCSLITCSYEP